MESHFEHIAWQLGAVACLMPPEDHRPPQHRTPSSSTSVANLLQTRHSLTGPINKTHALLIASDTREVDGRVTKSMEQLALRRVPDTDHWRGVFTSHQAVEGDPSSGVTIILQVDMDAEYATPPRPTKRATAVQPAARAETPADGTKP